VVVTGIGALLWFLGHPVPAVVVVTLAVVVGLASLASPGFAHGVDRVMGAVGHAVGTGLTFVLLGLLHVFVVIPVWLVTRVIRRDPLALGASPTAESLWRDAPSGNRRKLYRRQFTDERVAHLGRGLRGRLPLVRTRAVLGLVVLVVLADLAAGAAVDAVQRARTSDEEEQQLVLPLPDSPSRAGEPWADELNREMSTNLLDLRYDPVLGWTLPDYAGEHYTMADGVRRSYEPAVTGPQRPVRVFFFGGSTMWGMYQRDEQTIPSRIAKLAEADGIPIEVVNYGTGAYVNWQEVLLLQQLLARGDRPDLAVFYDGVNEIMSQFRVGLHTTPTHLQADDVRATLEAGRRARRGEGEESLASRVAGSWSDTSAMSRVARSIKNWIAEGEPEPAPAALSSFWSGSQLEQAPAAGANAAALYQQGVDVARRLADSYGVDSAFFWQPSLYTKQPGPGDREATGRWGEDPNAWRTATAASRQALREPVVDLGAALDVPDAVMYDYVHTNERGAEAIAAAMYETLRPQLLALSQGGAG
jgi:lysophospholipase L1-like esterase